MVGGAEAICPPNHKAGLDAFNVLEEELAVHACSSGGLVLEEVVQELARLELHEAVETRSICAGHARLEHAPVQLVLGAVLPSEDQLALPGVGFVQYLDEGQPGTAAVVGESLDDEVMRHIVGVDNDQVQGADLDRRQRAIPLSDFVPVLMLVLCDGTQVADKGISSRPRRQRGLLA